MKRWAIAGISALCVASPLEAQVVADYGWLTDGRRYRVGDIVTVVVDEYTAASADRTTSALEGRSTDAGVGGRLGSTVVDGSLGSTLANESTQRGRDIRQDRLNSEVSVRVTEVQADGTLSIEGTKTVMIDDHTQEVTVRGVLRPQDILADNTVLSWRIADVEVEYTTNGELAKADKSMISKILGWIIP